MKTNRYIYALFSCLFAFSLHAQTTYLDQISIENILIDRQAERASVTFNLNLDELRINRNHLLQITPIVISANGQQSVELSPVYIVGRTRHQVLNRPFTWTGKTEISENALATVIRRNRTNQTIHYTDTFPFEEWSRNAHLLLRTEIVGCADCFIGMEEMSLINRLFPERFVPNFQIALILPDPEIPKRRSEDHSAMLNFPVGRHELLPNFGNNAAVLAEVDRVIREFKADENLTITDFTISGFASPEGSEASNLALSQRRAETFARFIEQTYGFTRDQIHVQWFGEDWDGLRRAVVASQLPNRDAIIHIIDTEPNFDARDALLIALDNGQTYNRLLREFYPALRRNDYSIAFISRPFATAEASILIETNPCRLNLREMWDVAQTFPEGSPEHKRIFNIAADTFPDLYVANLNAAVMALQHNNPDAALERLERIPSGNATAYNLWGVAFAMRGEAERARYIFNRAIQAGNTDARHNLQQLESMIENNH